MYSPKIIRNTATQGSETMEEKKGVWYMRWMAETAFSSIKRTFGEHVSSVKWNNIVNELMLKASIYNLFMDRMTTWYITSLCDCIQISYSTEQEYLLLPLGSESELECISRLICNHYTYMIYFWNQNYRSYCRLK